MGNLDPNIVGALIGLGGALLVAVVTVFLHYRRPRTHSDKEILLFFRTCLDRPALRVLFDQEVSEEHFNQAMEDTITALNTGSLIHRDDRLIIAQGGRRADLKDKHAQSELDVIVTLLQGAREVYQNAVNNGKVRIFEHEGRYYMPDRDAHVGATIDKARAEALRRFNDLIRSHKIHTIDASGLSQSSS